MAKSTGCTAIHEAGHAVMHIVLDLGLEAVTIVPDYAERTAGTSTHRGEWGNPAQRPGEQDDDTAALRMAAEEAFWLRHAIACYAGAEAVRQLCPHEPDPEAGAEHDDRMATDAVYEITHDEKSIELLYALAQRRCTLLVEYYRSEIRAVARALESKKTLTGDEARAAFRASLGRRHGGLMGW